MPKNIKIAHSYIQINRFNCVHKMYPTIFLGMKCTNDIKKS